VGAGVKIYQPDGSSDSYYIGYSYAASTAPDAFVIDVADKSQVSRYVIDLPAGVKYSILKYYTDAELHAMQRSAYMRKTGRSTLTTYGVLESFNNGVGWVVAEGPPYCDQRPMIAAKGDSGGVVWRFYNDGAAVAGILVGADTGKCCRTVTLWDGTSALACDNFYFHSHDAIASKLGVIGWR
jgi:hypothetical protein